MIGKRIGGRYEILSRLGDGGMAIVYKAKDLILDRIVAVKILRPELEHDEEFVRRFHREAESVASLSHPNIVAIYDIGEEEDCYYLVMEYVQGMTLKSFIKDYSPVSVQEAVHIMKQITLAIAHAHARGIVHRDIKPHNILIDESEHVKVTDFGIAVAVTGSTITYTHSIMGSAHYLSPEQARGNHATVKSDIYALGIVMFELFTGRLPFPGSSPVSVALKHLRDPIPFPKDFRPDLPQSLENIMIRALRKNPDDRYASATEMYEDLSTALDPERADEERLPADETQPVSPDDEKTIRMAPLFAADQAGPPDLPKSELPEDPNPGKKKVRKKGRAKRWLTALGIFFLLITAGLVIGLYLLPKLFYVETVTVPDVTGKPYDEAVRILKEQDLSVNREERPSGQVKKESIISQDPSSGSEVKARSEVELIVSSGPQTVKLDDYVGYSRESLEDALKEEGFKEVVWHEEASEDVDEGDVIRQNPKAGSEIIPSDTVLELTVSTGDPQVTVPDLQNKSQEEVVELLQDQQLSADFITGDYSDEVAEGRAMDQDPEAGTRVKSGSTIIVSLSKGAEPKSKEVDQPIKVEYPADTAGPPEDRPTIHVQIYYTDANHTNAVFVNEEIRETKTYTIPFVIDPGEQGSYRVLINGEVKKEDTIDYPG